MTGLRPLRTPLRLLALVVAAGTADAERGDVVLVDTGTRREAILDAVPWAGGLAFAGEVGFGPLGNSDGWIGAADASGTILRSRVLGGARSDVLECVVAARDGGLLAAGTSASFGSGTGNRAWVVRLDAAGDVRWQRTVSSDQGERFLDAIETATGWVLAGWTGAGSRDAWHVAITDAGDLASNTALGGSSFDYAHAATELPDGDVVLVGSTFSGTASDEWWIAEVAPDGTPRAQWSLGTPLPDALDAVVALPDGSVVVGGAVSIPPRSVPMVARVRLDGVIDWQLAWPAAGRVEALALRPDGTLVAAGSIGDRPWLAVLDLSGAQLREMELESPSAGPWMTVATLPGGDIVLAGSGAGLTIQDGTLAVLDAALDLRQPCPLRVPPLVPFDPGLTMGPASLAARSLPLVVAEDSAATLADAPVTTGFACPVPPEEPMPLRVSKDPVALRFPMPAGAAAFNLHEGPIGAFRPPALHRCHARVGDAGVTLLPSGDVEIVHAPTFEDAWLLVSSSNVAAESSIGRGSDGPIDDPPSPWRCGPSP